MRVSLLLPPLTQLNSPYPGPAYLARALRRHGVSCSLRDLGIELVLGVFSEGGLRQVFDTLEGMDDLPDPAWQALAHRRQHERVVGPVIRFLQGRDRTLASRILDTPFLPPGPRLAAADLDGFGALAADDAARHLATLYLSDLADLVTSTIDEGFALARYHHHLAAGLASFDPLVARLGRTTLVDARLDALADSVEADLVGLSVPFPGNLYGALRIGRRLRARGIPVLMGGGYVNTELRDVAEPRLWDHVDALCYDDGEGPLLAWIEHLRGGPDRRHRTRTREGLLSVPPGPGRSAAASAGASLDRSAVGPAAEGGSPVPDIKAESAAWYADLRLDHYLQLVDSLNPAHRLWSDGRWNKITLAHGCYWRRCSFCDIGLDYVAGYAPSRASVLADQIAEVVADTGQSGFHFVDEAAPPRVLRDLSLELLARGTQVSLWGNLRFERAYTPDLCRLLAAAGLIAVTGGLEVASDRLLARMDKGVTVEQVACAARAFRDAGTMVHAYLMYGFPTQTEQETIDSMELVRQLFAAGVLSSAFWHRFVLTRHSGMYPRAAEYGAVVLPEPPSRFASNDVPHADPLGADHDRFDDVLPRALAAWMRGRDLERPVTAWFDRPMPAPTEPSDRILRALAAPPPPMGERLVWIGGDMLEDDGAIMLHTLSGPVRVAGRRAERDWLHEVLEAARPGQPPLAREAALAAFPGDWERFATRWDRVRAAGLLGIS